MIPTGNRIGSRLFSTKRHNKYGRQFRCWWQQSRKHGLIPHGSDATTKNYVDDNTAAFAELELLRDLEINTPAEKDLLVFTGKKIIYTNPETGGAIINGDTIRGTASGATGTVVDISSVTDEILGSQRKIVYTPTLGTFNTGTDTVTNGTAVSQ